MRKLLWDFEVLNWEILIGTVCDLLYNPSLVVNFEDLDCLLPIVDTSYPSLCELLLQCGFLLLDVGVWQLYLAQVGASRRIKEDFVPYEAKDIF